MLFPLPLILIIGVLVGGVLNALADDLPHHRSLRLPHYPDGETRPLIAWLGLTAFAFNKRISSKGAALSWRHPVTELVTAGIMALTVWVTADDVAMSETRLVFWLIYMAIFVLVTVIDIEHKLILFSVMIPSAIIALIDAFFEPLGPDWQSALIGGAVGFGIFFILYLGGHLFIYVMSKTRNYAPNEVAFGYGDVMLITVSGLILGWEALLVTIFITVFLGAAGALTYILGRQFTRGRYRLFTALPYGPYIVAATVLMLLFANEIGRLLRLPM
jgi:leader peptidase (prepilin peptidase)/N-methyltransferase